MPKYTLSRQIS